MTLPLWTLPLMVSVLIVGWMCRPLPERQGDYDLFTPIFHLFRLFYIIPILLVWIVYLVVT